MGTMSKDKTTTGKALLENAYALGTPEDNKAYYRGFAETYDTEFAQGLGYTYPHKIAETFQRLSGPADWPVADIGCGTGLVAASLP